MKIKNKRIVVTGGAGFIPSNLVEGLLELDNEVIAVDNFSKGKNENLKEAKKNNNFKLIRADIRETNRMINALKGVDIVFHLAVQGLRESLSNPIAVHDVNATGTLSILEAAYRNKVKRFIYCSSSEVYGTAKYVPMSENHSLQPTTVYGASKLVGEMYTTCYNRNFGLDTVIVRPFNTYGYHSHYSGPYGEVIPRFVIRVKNGLSPIIFGDGTQTRDFTFVTDTVRGLIAAAGKDELVGDAINIARGKEVSIKDIAKIVIELVGINVAIDFQEERPHDVHRHYADVTKAKKMLNFEAEIEIKDGIKKYIDYLNKNKTNFKELLKELPDRNW